jgi:hypothetical protein
MPDAELARWRFNDPAHPVPEALRAVNIHVVQSWSGYALSMSGSKPSLLALPAFPTAARTNLSPNVGTFRFWFSPDWSSDSKGSAGPRRVSYLFTVGAWSGRSAQTFYSLRTTADGSALEFNAHLGKKTRTLAKAPIAWRAGEWHQIALAWSPAETVIYLDGKAAAKGPPTTLRPSAVPVGPLGFCLGSDVYGRSLAQGQFDEVFSFDRAANEAELAGNFRMIAPLAALGPLTAEEKAQPLEKAAPQPALALLITAPSPCGNLLLPEVTLGPDALVTLRITNVVTGVPVDLFATDALVDNTVANAYWRWLGRGTNGQVITLTNSVAQGELYLLGCTNDVDGDGLTDAYEILVTKTSPTNQFTSGSWLNDGQLENVLVNDPKQDYGTDQNTQDETTLLAFSNTVVAAWVDSNLGVTGYGKKGAAFYVETNCACLSNCPVQKPLPQFIGWAVSRDGGTTFADQGALPMFSNVVAFVVTNSLGGGHLTNTHLGNAGDPVLARDETSGTIYLVGNPQRPSVYYPQGTGGPPALVLPLWRSTNNAASFVPPINPFAGLQPASTDSVLDKPALVVDNFPGPGNGNVYLAVTWQKPSPINLLVARSVDGVNWTNSAEFQSAEAPTLTIGRDHTVYLLWTGNSGGTNRFFFSKSSDLGTNFSAGTVILTNNSSSSDLRLRRFNGTDASDFFRTAIIPTLAADPVNTNNLYLVFHDASTNASDKADIFFLQSTNRGTNWSPPMRVNSDTTTNDQWQPVLTVKPDGTQLFIAWYDRREDLASNSLIRIYGAFASLPITNSASFASNFPISTVTFPPAFTGTNTAAGSYDSTYPPKMSPTDPRSCTAFSGIYAAHMGDYDTAVSDNEHVYYAWADNRLVRAGSTGIRNQADIRLIKLPWP